ncbi:MAG: ribonuclease III [Candidatus Syntrophoarchaeum sp. GoM_oil]|nr:MAG: ribonuclease III [Candidatus Syntrophoarchaeum sp. GoM_oil]
MTEDRKDLIMAFIGKQFSIDPGNKDITHYENAFTHSSFNPEDSTLCDNDRLAFLGDAVLKLILSEELYNRFPTDSKGDLTIRKAGIENNEALADIAEKLGVEELLLLGADKQKSIRAMAGVIEALIGATYLDFGFDEARLVVMNLVGEGLEKEVEPNYKSMLQEYFQKRGVGVPQYIPVSEGDIESGSRFEVIVKVNGRELGRGWGRNIQQAGKAAAKDAIHKGAIEL